MADDTDAISEADVKAQDAADDLAEAKQVERNNQRWVHVLVPVLQAAHYDESWQVSQDVKDALDALAIAACARLRRLLECDLPSDRSK